MPTDIETTSTNAAGITLVSRHDGEQTPITVDNDNFDDAHDFLIEKRDIHDLGIQIHNTGATNGLSFEIYGSIVASETAPTFSLENWELTPNGSGNVALSASKIFEAKFVYIWLLVRLKRQSAGASTTADITVTGAF